MSKTTAGNKLAQNMQTVDEPIGLARQRRDLSAACPPLTGREVERGLKAVLRRVEYAAAMAGENEDSVEYFNRLTSVAALAAVAGMSERSLRDRFKMYTGMKISRYVSRRRAEYVARMLRLFPEMSKTDVADVMGLSSPHALYPLLKKNGVDDVNALTVPVERADVALEFRIERLPDCVMFYLMDDVEYSECGDTEFEAENWGRLDAIVRANFPGARKLGDVGFAIDRYIEGKTEEGIFMAGVLYGGISRGDIDKEVSRVIGCQFMARQRAAVFTHRGPYEGLDDFYMAVLETVRQERLDINRSRLLMEKYLNSPTDVAPEELMTELWVPLLSDRRR